MHRLFNNLISFCLLFLLISHGIIQFGMFELFRADYRSEAARLMGEGVPEHSQVVFSFDKKQFENRVIQVDWKADDEFRFEGKLFDVMRTEIIGDSVFLYCMYDEDDTKLYSVLDGMNKDDKDTPKNTEIYGNFLSQYYFCSDFDYNPDNPGSIEKIFINLEVNPLKGEYLIITPPPRYTV